MWNSTFKGVCHEVCSEAQEKKKRQKNQIRRKKDFIIDIRGQ
jgi:hypothetical protein